MAFFTDMKRSLTETGKQVAQKTKELSDTVQLKAQLSRAVSYTHLTKTAAPSTNRWSQSLRS